MTLPRMPASRFAARHNEALRRADDELSFEPVEKPGFTDIEQNKPRGSGVNVLLDSYAKERAEDRRRRGLIKWRAL